MTDYNGAKENRGELFLTCVISSFILVGGLFCLSRNNNEKKKKEMTVSDSLYIDSLRKEEFKTRTLILDFQKKHKTK